jgi:predicted PurR-regulated permease PerM
MVAPESTVARNALVLLAVIAAGAMLYWLADILTPLALAVFLAVMIDGFARVLRRRLPRLSKSAALPVAVVLSILLFFGAGFVIADNATVFAGQLVTYTPRLNALIARVAGMMGLEVTPTIGELFRQFDPTSYLGTVAGAVQNFASNAVFILIYLGFILASRRGFERKIVGLFPNREERQDSVEAFIRIRDGVEQYLWVQTITGLIIAVASGVVMAVVGIHNVVFWAFLIFIVSYIPVVGGIVGVLAPPVFALVEFDTVWPAVILLVALQTIQFVVGNVILPRMQGRSLNMDPIAVLLALAFWGKIWGVAGMFLSTPLTVMAMVILAQFDGGRWVAVLLSADGEPERLKEPSQTTPQAPDHAARTAAKRTPRTKKS